MKAAILTVSDRSAAGKRSDVSGPVLREMLENLGWDISRQEIVPDDPEQIIEVLRNWSDSGAVDLILTTGGTGFGRRDCTPEATQAVIDRPAPGLAEAMRAASMHLTPHAMLSRAAAGIRKNTLIVNLPGSPRAARENLQVILPALPHAVQLLQDDPGSEAGHSASSNSMQA